MKRSVFGLLLLSVLTMNSCVAGSAAATATPGYYPDLSVSMSHAYGWGQGGYLLAIDGNGNVNYEAGCGIHPCPPETASGKITPQQIEGLVAAIKLANVWALKDSYGIGEIICSDCGQIKLSFTLNGQSKQISYYDPGCSGRKIDRQIMGQAPQELCDLQHEIEAIRQGVLPTPTPPPPTSTPPAIMRSGDFGILSQKPCGPPCFLGIRPGVTTLDEAALILKNAGLPCTAEDIPQQGKDLVCERGDTQVSVATFGLCTAGSMGPMVGGVGLRSPAKITIGQFIAQYGPPDALMLRWPQATFAYESLQTFVFLPMQPGRQTYTVTPDNTIDEVAYVTVAEYPVCVHMAENNRQLWRGFGTYTPNTGP